MRVTYVLPEPELNGGNKVVLQHAALLQELGHEVTVTAEGARPAWASSSAAWVDRNGGLPPLASQDLVVATYWTTVALAQALAAGPVAHFCQGYEGALPHLEPQRVAIEAVYALPLPTLVVARHLGALVASRFGRESRPAPPPLDPLFRPRLRWGPGRAPWVALPGIFESAVKDVPTGLAALRRLRERGVACRLLRISTFPLTAAESALLSPDRYLCGVSPRLVAEALRGCGALLLTSREGEGFGLPLLEAMASGVPAVASRIGSTVEIAAGDAVALVPPGDVEAFADAAATLLGSAARWRQARRRGLAGAQRYAPERVGPLVEAAVRWAAAWRPSPAPAG
jgi:hypothetical protein